MPNVLQTDMFYEVGQSLDIRSKVCCMNKRHNADLPMSLIAASTAPLAFCTVAFQCDMLSLVTAAAAAVVYLKYTQADDRAQNAAPLACTPQRQQHCTVPITFLKTM